VCFEWDASVAVVLQDVLVFGAKISCSATAEYCNMMKSRPARLHV
jgi:hypothetical protein